LPENFDSLSEEEKKLTLQDRVDAGLHAAYEQLTRNIPHAHALLTHEHYGTVMQPFLACLYSQWENVTGGDVTRRCPFQFSDDERTRLMEKGQRSPEYDKNVDSLRRELGCLEDGWVSTESFEEALAKSKQMESEWDEGERGGPYPFRDGITPLMT